MNNFIFETDHYTVLLNTDGQLYIGRSLVILKRECETLSSVTKEEWLDFAEVVKKYEKAIRSAFNATLFNWACLMNAAYTKKPYNPQVHWHVRPRYESKVNFQGLEWEDTAFGDFFLRGRAGEERKESEGINNAIIAEIQKNL